MKRSGFTLIETVVAMMVIAILAAILIPVVSRYVDDARVAKAQADVKAIAEAIAVFEKDVGRYPLYTSAATLNDAAANVVRLEGPGAAVSGPSPWTGATADANCVATAPPCTSDTFDNQLVANTPGYPTSANPGKPFKWKGPYAAVTEDPWGRRYLVNMIKAVSASSSACFVISAGPDGQIQTPFVNPQNASLSPSGDDIIYRIR